MGHIDFSLDWTREAQPGPAWLGLAWWYYTRLFKSLKQKFNWLDDGCARNCQRETERTTRNGSEADEDDDNDDATHWRKDELEPARAVVSAPAASLRGLLPICSRVERKFLQLPDLNNSKLPARQPGRPHAHSRPLTLALAQAAAKLVAPTDGSANNNSNMTKLISISRRRVLRHASKYQLQFSIFFFYIYIYFDFFPVFFWSLCV